MVACENMRMYIYLLFLQERCSCAHRRMRDGEWMMYKRGDVSSLIDAL